MLSLHKKKTTVNPLSTADLYDLADEKSISVFAFELPCTKSMALLCEDGTCCIGIDDTVTSADEHVMLGHEIGHCLTGEFYNRHAPDWERGKSEYKATKWAILNLCPHEALCAAWKEGITEIWSLAEYFNVPEDFMRRVISFYKNVQ